MKSTSIARQAMFAACRAPGGADCPVDECGKCRFNGLKPKDPYVQTCFLPKGEDCKGGPCDGCCWYKPNRDKLAELKEEVEKKREEVRMYEGHNGFMDGVKSYGNHCRSTESVCTPKSFEVSAINGITHLLQDYIRRGICEVNVDEWDDHVLVQVIVYDDVVRMKRYRTVNNMLPDSVSSAKSDNHNYKQLPKPIRILVELGSKDSVEYKNSEEYKKEHQNTNQQTNKERKMNLEEAMKNPDKLAGQAAEGAYDALLHVAEVMTRTYGKRLNDDQRLHAVSAIEASCKAYLDAKACERVIVNSDWGPEGDFAVPEDPEKEPQPLDEPRYAGEAMLKDDIVRSSMYDLSDVKFDVGPVDFAGYIKPIDPSDDNVPTWRARAVFTVGDCEVQSWFEFDEKGSAIANSVKAFDRMVHDGILHKCFDYKPVPEDMGACKGGENE